MQISTSLLIALFLFFTISGCQNQETAVAHIESIHEESDVQGTIRFEEYNDYVQISGSVTRLEQGAHGFHIHEGTSCEEYGGHYNPENTEHGAPGFDEHHVGDLGNINVESNNQKNLDRINHTISLSGPQSIVGRVVIIHQGRDDLTSQPAGNAGPEIGCGRIELTG